MKINFEGNDSYYSFLGGNRVKNRIDAIPEVPFEVIETATYEKPMIRITTWSPFVKVIEVPADECNYSLPMINWKQDVSLLQTPEKRMVL